MTVQWGQSPIKCLFRQRIWKRFGAFFQLIVFATEAIAYQEGAIFKGNLRTEAEDAFAQLSQKLNGLMGDKYRLFLVEGSEDRPVVVVLPSSNDPQPGTLVKNLAVVLMVATMCHQS